MEHADICELEDEKSIILNLKDRFKKSIIYVSITLHTLEIFVPLNLHLW